MVSTVVSLAIIFLGSMSASCQAAPLHETRSDNTSVTSPGSIQKTPKFFISRNQEVLPGFLRQLNKLEGMLKRISSERLVSVVGKVHNSLSSIARLKDRLQPSNNKRHSPPTPSQPHPNATLTEDRLNASNSLISAKNTTRSNVIQITSTSQRYDDGGDDVAVTTDYESYFDQLIRGGFTDFYYTTTAPSNEYINPYLKVSGTHNEGTTDSTEHSNSYVNIDGTHKEGTADSTEHSNFYLKVSGTHNEGTTDSTEHSNSYINIDGTHKEGTADSTEHSSTYLNVDGIHTEGITDSSGYKIFSNANNNSVNSKNISQSAVTRVSYLPKNNATSEIMKVKESTVKEEFQDTKKHPENIILFDKDENNYSEVKEEEYILTKVLVEEGFRSLAISLPDTTKERPIEYNRTVNTAMLKRMFTPANNTVKLSSNVKTAVTGCTCESHNLNVSTVISENKTHNLQRFVKTIETKPNQYSESSKLYVKTQTPDVLAFNSELTQYSEDSDDTETTDDYEDSYDDTKQDGSVGSNTYVASEQMKLNFTRDVELLDRTVGLYTILELLPLIRKAYLSNQLSDEDAEYFKNIYGIMWKLVNSTELFGNITRISNISKSEPKEDVTRVTKEAEASGEKTLIRKTRSAPGDGRKSNYRHRHSSTRTKAGKKHERGSERRKQTQTKPKEHRRKPKRNHIHEQLSDRPKRIDTKRSRRRPRSHGVVNTTVSEAAAILALLAEDGGSIQLDAPGEDDDYYEGYDYTYADDYDNEEQDYYKDEAGEGEDASSELAKYYSNNDDPSVRELISLASRHRERKAKLNENTAHETEKGQK